MMIMPQTVTLSVRKITRVYRSATLAQLLEGQGWYGRAREIAATLDPLNPRRAAAVIAVLSPKTSWERNVVLACDVYAGRTLTGCLPDNARKAEMIMNGADPALVVSGPKVTAFWQTIMDPQDRYAVVVDRHAFDVAAGKITDDATRGAVLGRKAGYASVCDLYRRAATILSREAGKIISPAEVQAVTWVVWRETMVQQAAANRRRRERAA